VTQLCFTTCANEGFLHGLKGLITSIRRLYSLDEARIVVFFEERSDEVAAFCRAHGAEYHHFDEIESWRRPLMQSDSFLSDMKHFYHEKFQLLPDLPHHLERSDFSVDKVHHLHPLNVKAHCTAYCACVLEAPLIVHIDSDAFLLSKIDEIFLRYPAADTVIGFDDGTETLDHLEALYGISKPADFDPNLFAFNAGIVFYVNGPGLRRLMTEFSFYIDSCYHYTYSGSFADQGVLRALVAKHHLLDSIAFVKEDAANWNPTWFRADDLSFDTERKIWINAANGHEQHIWHGAGGEKVWTRRYPSPSVNEAWAWVGGEFEALAYENIKGSLIKPHCELLGQTIRDHFESTGKKKLQILEVGTQYGRTAVALCLILKSHGYDCHVDTFDIYAPSPDYPGDHATLAEAQRNVARFGLENQIRLHTVEPCEDISVHLSHAPDVVFIDGDHRYKPVIADCVVARKVLAPGGIILGDDYQLESVQAAVKDVFGQELVTALNTSLWSCCLSACN